jgi:hypothetical protein
MMCLAIDRDGPNGRQEGGAGGRGGGGGGGIAGSRLRWGANRREKQRCSGGTGCRAGKGGAAVWSLTQLLDFPGYSSQLPMEVEAAANKVEAVAAAFAAAFANRTSHSHSRPEDLAAEGGVHAFALRQCSRISITSFGHTQISL